MKQARNKRDYGYESFDVDWNTNRNVSVNALDLDLNSFAGKICSSVGRMRR